MLWFKTIHCALNPMKQLLMSLLGTLLGVLLALALYDHYVLQPRAAEQANAVTSDLADTVRQAQAISAEVDASVKRSVDSAREALDAQASDQNKRRMASGAIAQTQRYKVALTEAFIANGKWPTHPAEAGLPPHSTDAGGAVRDIVVSEQGKVSVLFNESFARDARFELVPSADKDSFQVSWRCLTSGDPDLQRYFPQCTWQ